MIQLWVSRVPVVEELPKVGIGNLGRGVWEVGVADTPLQFVEAAIGDARTSHPDFRSAI